MSQAKVNKLYRTFVKGLVTEASPLTFPPDTSFAEDNCLNFMMGNRTRRLGVDFEEDYTLSSHMISQEQAVEYPLIEYVWRNVNNIEGLDFLCQQVGPIIYFYDCSGIPTSPELKSFTIDLASYYVGSAVDPQTTPVQMISGKGYLFIASTVIDPLIVEYDEITNSITVESIDILIRDFDGVEDDLAVEEEPSTLSIEHNYNLQNQGWTSEITTTQQSFTLFGTKRIGVTTSTSVKNSIDKYKEVIGRYPGNNKQWFLGKVEVADKSYQPGDFSPLLLNKIHVGNSRAPRGHFIFNAFNKDRSAVSGIANLAADVEITRPISICFATGRVWYAHQNTVYFSQILSSKARAGLCFQDNDPTSEEISDLLANDGGVIPIPAADKIVLIKEVSNGIMVFANNGVWFISGGDKGFSADDYQVSKVSSIGTDAPYSVVDTDNHIYWWSKTGIQRIEQSTGMFGPVSGSFKSVNLTESTIDTFIKDISTLARVRVKGIFDYGTNTVQWLYATADNSNHYFYNRVLNFNTILESFYPWSLTSGSYPYICGIYTTSDINRLSNSQNVVSDGSDVVAGSDQVVALGTTISAKDTFIQYIAAVPDSTNYKFTICNFINDDYVDWEQFDGTGINYNSYVETGYEIHEDAMRNKWIVYLQTFFRQTEENYVEDGDDYTVDKPSSCYLTTKWDWSNSSASNKYSNKTQAYRLTRMPFVNELNLTLDTGFKVVANRHKIRGTGKAVQFRFECNERGKNFDLLGWQVLYSGNTEV